MLIAQPELAHPYDVLTKAGVELTIASPKGGDAPLDPSSVEMFKSDAVATKFLQEKKALWQNTRKISDFLGKSDEFDAVFVPGGHGPMFDLAVDADSQRLIAEFAGKGKVVSAVCHGPAALVNVRLSDGKHLLEGKKVTGFSNVEEEQVGLTGSVPFLLEDELRKNAASYEAAAEPWGEKVVVDGRLITGQNPASSKGVGEAILKAIS
ncbi:Class I glutamine amidotransferase-like protein [Coniochaeta hoffmannii]|uniref:D-lactate dehydratase n=1 Tax=Coniochaeta hoffmannii TaxID=91930 RepID=A0AA38VL67_9PEZI|nr:Class I glutamine amidotransferase-like protein [Coniochaeta hoffmannii]